MNSQFGTVFQKKVFLPGKTPNHLKFRILERRNTVLKSGLKISFGLFISAEYKRSQNPDNHNISLSTSTNNRLVPPTEQLKTWNFFLASFGIWMKSTG